MCCIQSEHFVLQHRSILCVLLFIAGVLSLVLKRAAAPPVHVEPERVANERVIRWDLCCRNGSSLVITGAAAPPVHRDPERVTNECVIHWDLCCRNGSSLVITEAAASPAHAQQGSHDSLIAPKRWYLYNHSASLHRKDTSAT